LRWAMARQSQLLSIQSWLWW